MRRAGTIFRAALLLAIVVILAWLVLAARVGAPAAPEPAPPAEPGEQLLVPVAGVARAALVDTYSQGRAQGARRHDAIDIVAPRGTPVIAAAAGVVEKLYFSRGGGGITAYVRSPDRQWTYYYAHLDAYAPRLREGGRVARGDPIGTVGSTGNADPAGPHLHFAIHAMTPGESWWQGRPINPYPLLAARGPRR